MCQLFVLRITLSDLPSPAEASFHAIGLYKGFAPAGNRFTLFGIMRQLIAFQCGVQVERRKAAQHGRPFDEAAAGSIRTPAASRPDGIRNRCPASR
jgi:hypothetical protein